MRRHNYHEEIEVYGAADRVRVEAGGDGGDGRGGVPEDGRQRGDVLQLEEEVRWPWDRGVEAVKAARRRESAIEAGGGGSDVGQADAAGRVKKKCLKAKQKKQLVRWILDSYRVSESRACSVVAISRKVFRYIERPRDDRALRKRMREIAETRVRYGFWRIQTVLRREGWRDNHKRTYRIYKEEGLNLRRKRPRRRKAAAHRMERPVLTGPHECWSMDFVADQLFDGRRFRVLTLVDNFSRECLEIEVGQSLKGPDVVNVMERIKRTRGLVPNRIQVDNGSEFISKVLDHWAYENDVTLDFSRPGKPTDNAFIESFNGSFRDECLNVNWFLSIEDAAEKVQAFKHDYNGFRPHSALCGLTPNEAVQKHQETRNSLI